MLFLQEGANGFGVIGYNALEFLIYAAGFATMVNDVSGWNVGVVDGGGGLTGARFGGQKSVGIWMGDLEVERGRIELHSWLVCGGVVRNNAGGPTPLSCVLGELRVAGRTVARCNRGKWHGGGLEG